MDILAFAITIFAETVSSKLHLESYMIFLIRAKDTSNTQHDPVPPQYADCKNICDLGALFINAFLQTSLEVSST